MGAVVSMCDGPQVLSHHGAYTLCTSQNDAQTKYEARLIMQERRLALDRHGRRDGEVE